MVLCDVFEWLKRRDGLIVSCWRRALGKIDREQKSPLFIEIRSLDLFSPIDLMLVFELGEQSSSNSVPFPETSSCTHQSAIFFHLPPLNLSHHYRQKRILTCVIDNSCEGALTNKY